MGSRSGTRWLSSWFGGTAGWIVAIALVAVGSLVGSSLAGVGAVGGVPSGVWLRSSGGSGVVRVEASAGRVVAGVDVGPLVGGRVWGVREGSGMVVVWGPAGMVVLDRAGGGVIGRVSWPQGADAPSMAGARTFAVPGGVIVVDATGRIFRWKLGDEAWDVPSGGQRRLVGVVSSEQAGVVLADAQGVQVVGLSGARSPRSVRVPGGVVSIGLSGGRVVVSGGAGIWWVADGRLTLLSRVGEVVVGPYAGDGGFVMGVDHLGRLVRVGSDGHARRRTIGCDPGTNGAVVSGDRVYVWCAARQQVRIFDARTLDLTGTSRASVSPVGRVRLLPVAGGVVVDDDGSQDQPGAMAWVVGREGDVRAVDKTVPAGADSRGGTDPRAGDGGPIDSSFVGALDPSQAPTEEVGPVARDDLDLSARSGGAASLAVLINDTDLNQDVLAVDQVSEISDPRVKVWAGGAAGAWLQAPQGYEGRVSFRYRITDGRCPEAAARGVSCTASATATVVVFRPGSSNHRPTVTPDAIVLSQGKADDVRVLDGATDPDGDALAIASILDAAGLGVTILDSGDAGRRHLLHVDTGSAQLGPHRVRYVVSDGHGPSGTASAELLVTVTDPKVNQRPVARPDSVDGVPGTEVAVDVLHNDEDPERGPLTLQAVDAPGHVVEREVRVVIPPSGATLSLAYVVADEAGATSEGRLTVSARPTGTPVAPDGGGTDSPAPPDTTTTTEPATTSTTTTRPIPPPTTTTTTTPADPFAIRLLAHEAQGSGGGGFADVSGWGLSDDGTHAVVTTRDALLVDDVNDQIDGYVINVVTGATEWRVTGDLDGSDWRPGSASWVWGDPYIVMQQVSDDGATVLASGDGGLGSGDFWVINKSAPRSDAIGVGGNGIKLSPSGSAVYVDSDAPFGNFTSDMNVQATRPGGPNFAVFPGESKASAVDSVSPSRDFGRFVALGAVWDGTTGTETDGGLDVFQAATSTSRRVDAQATEISAVSGNARWALVEVPGGRRLWNLDTSTSTLYPAGSRMATAEVRWLSDDGRSYVDNSDLASMVSVSTGARTRLRVGPGVGSAVRNYDVGMELGVDPGNSPDEAMIYVKRIR
jgi:hypothetical protein